MAYEVSAVNRAAEEKSQAVAEAGASQSAELSECGDLIWSHGNHERSGERQRTDRERRD